MTHFRNASITVAAVLAAAVSPALAQRADSALTRSTPMAATSATVVPMLIRYDGVAVRGNSAYPATGASITFLIYKDESGGEPLWIETQSVAIDSAGRYEVYLGSTYTSGLPPGLFGTGEARWLEIQIAGEAPAPRTLLTSVPYALKAADAATLGGLPASAFVLASATPGVSAITGNAITPDAASNVTTTGGTNYYLPRFSGASTVINSQVYDNGTSVGIGDVPNASAKLDVNGPMIMRGNMTVSRTGNATSSKAYPSYGFDFFSNAYNSSTKATDNPYFQLQSEPTGNDTSSPSATFNLLFSNNGSTPAETGLYINPNGTVHFANGQTFASTESSTVAVDGTSSSGNGVQGNSTSSNGVYGQSSSGDGLQGVTAGTTLGTAGVYGVAGSGNTSGFTGIAGVWGDANASVGVFGSSTQYSGVDGVSANSYGVQGTSSSSYGVDGTTNATSGAAAGVYGYASNALPGVKGSSGLGDGGDFYGGGFSYGLQGIGGSSTDGVGTGGNFSGGGEDGGGGGAAGGGLQSTGGLGDVDNGGFGVTGSGGYSNEGNGGAGGIFTGGGSTDGNGGYGIYVEEGVSSTGSSNDAGYFNGNISLTGTVYANSGPQSMIDDPRDPANKYLSHVSVQSSEMVNIYSGNVVTDEQGLATVKLPEWFEAYNGDLRYQLTTVGHKAQAWVSEEVKEGKFQISSDMANVKISWQITGVRQDPYAKAHPLVVERVKDIHERGFYKNPELYGQPKEKQTEWGRNPAMMKRLAAQRAKAQKPQVKTPTSDNLHAAMQSSLIEPTDK